MNISVSCDLGYVGYVLYSIFIFYVQPWAGRRCEPITCYADRRAIQTFTEFPRINAALFFTYNTFYY